jgi:hypothetical protein
MEMDEWGNPYGLSASQSQLHRIILRHVLELTRPCASVDSPAAVKELASRLRDFGDICAGLIKNYDSITAQYIESLELQVKLASRLSPKGIVAGCPSEEKMR